MRYLLDTNAVIALFNHNEALKTKLKACAPAEVCISSLVAHELYYGAYKSQRREHNVAKVDNLPFEVLEFDKEDACKAGEIRAALALGGSPIGPYDVLIAGQALARNLTLISHNVKEFSRIAELSLENWQ